MNETNKSTALADSQKPVQAPGNSLFPPFPAPLDEDYDEDISQDERTYYTNKFKDLNNITNMKVHCTSCDRHLGLTPKNENRMRTHPLLRTLVCQTCFTFYNSGEFEKGDDGSELYCRWCGQGGQVYCCSSCPHVFCAKCIKRNLGPTKIKEIEDLDDWKCFKCNPKCLRDLRAICWAALRYCDLKNRFANDIEDTAKKESLIQDCAQDHSECCKAKLKKKLDARKKEVDKKTNIAISKIPPTIQVKKFASINMEEVQKQEKKGQKRPASPKNKPFILKNPITVASKVVNTFNVSPMTKKMRVCMPSGPVVNPIRIMHDRKQVQQPNNFLKIRSRASYPIMYNGVSIGSYNNNLNNDNINLSLDSLTQGLDMATMSNMAGGSQDDELVCTPDFPMEPLCEVTEDNTDDDVQCITPGPSAATKGPPPLVPCSSGNDLASDNIVQMTDQDVTVNALTGGLKFRVDPQTLSSKKMYRLPDGRVFAINANPNMPGGYSATIVAVTESNSTKTTGSTFAAKMNHVPSRQTMSTRVQSSARITSTPNSSSSSNQRQKNIIKTVRSVHTPTRETDFQVPVEWYRYNLLDAIDALEYSLSRLHKLKNKATTSFLRTRCVSEMRSLHRSLENLLNTSTQRFKEIRENINKELKQYIARKTNSNFHNSDDDDDDVEILPDVEEDPIFIDENSLGSSANETQEVDLTGPGSSEHNDSDDKIVRDRLNVSIEMEDEVPVNISNKDSAKGSKNVDTVKESDTNGDEQTSKSESNESISDTIDNQEDIRKGNNQPEVNKSHMVNESVNKSTKTKKDNSDKKKDTDISDSVKSNKENVEKFSKEMDTENGEHVDNEDKAIDISDEMIDDLLKGDTEESTEPQDVCALEISDEVKDHAVK